MKYYLKFNNFTSIFYIRLINNHPYLIEEIIFDKGTLIDLHYFESKLAKGIGDYDIMQSMKVYYTACDALVDTHDLLDVWSIFKGFRELFPKDE